MVRKDGLRLYTPIERALLRTSAATLLRQAVNPMSAAEQLAAQQQIPLHDAIAFVAVAKQHRRNNAKETQRIRG